MKAVTDYVIAEFIDSEDRELPNGLILQAKKAKTTREAKVLTVGPQVEFVTDGDKICVPQHMIQPFTLGDKQLFRIRELDILVTYGDSQ